MLFGFLDSIIDWLTEADKELFLEQEGDTLILIAAVVLIALPVLSLLLSPVSQSMMLTKQILTPEINSILQLIPFEQVETGLVQPQGLWEGWLSGGQVGQLIVDDFEHTLSMHHAVMAGVNSLNR